MSTIAPPTEQTLTNLRRPSPLWTHLSDWGPHGEVWRHGELTVVRTVADYDGREWVHVSASHKHRCPNRREMASIKDAFLGDVWACQIHPPRMEYVNLHTNCLHFWSPADGVSPLPDFTCGSGSI